MKKLFQGVSKFVESKLTVKPQDFQNKGLLTPELFIQAGNQLTNFGWKWQGSLTNTKSSLPDPKKQFLSSNATSKVRIKSIMNQQIVQKVVDGFLIPELTQQPELNMSDFRKYKISITYDDYYHSPRMWISGNDIDGKPLSSKQIFEDIMSQYINQTVTEELHPFTGIRTVTVHPCKHSDVMKKFIDEAKKNGKKIKPHQTLLIFLKFMGSVMPTIEYDNTLDMEI